MNSIMTSDDASEENEFLSALNASLESFVQKEINRKQIECIHRIVCHGRDVLAMLPMGLGKSAIYQLISKGPYSQRPQNSLFFVGLQSGTVPSPSSASETYSLRTKQEDEFYKINHIFVGRTVPHCMQIHAVRALCNSRPRGDFW